MYTLKHHLNSIVFAWLLTLGVQLQAQTVLVSDIDDTIKASQVQSRFNKIRYAGALVNEIKGMSELYTHFASEMPGLKFEYLSSAPKILMQKNHASFLDFNSFPNGVLRLREVFFDSSFEHKVKNIEQIILKQKPQTLILIGDNAEMDPEIYNFIDSKYSNKINILQFIRVTYPLTAPLAENQTGFISPLEICLKVEEAGLAPCQDSLIEHFFQEMLSEESSSNFGSYYFHPYMNCKGYQWPDLNLTSPEKLDEISSFLESKCI